MADQYPVSNLAQIVSQIGAISALNAAQAQPGLGASYNNYVQNQMPANAQRYQDATTLGGISYANPGTSYGYSAPSAAMVEAMYRKPTVSSNLVTSVQPSMVPLAAMAATQTALNDRQAQGAAMMAQGIEGANKMQFQGYNSPLNQELMNPNNAINAAVTTAGLQNNQFDLMNKNYAMSKEFAPGVGQQIIDANAQNLTLQRPPEVLTKPQPLQGDYLSSDRNNQIRVGDTIKAATPMVAQYQQVASQAPVNMSRYSELSGAINKLAPGNSISTSSGWDALKGQAAKVLSTPEMQQLQTAQSAYQANPNPETVRSYLGALIGVDGATQLSDADINKMATPHKNNDGVTTSYTFSNPNIQQFIARRGQNENINITKDWIAQDTYGNLQQNASGSPAREGLTDFSAYVNNRAIPLQAKINNLTGKFTDDSGFVHYHDGTQDVSMPSSLFYLRARKRGDSDKDIAAQLGAFGIPQNGRK